MNMINWMNLRDRSYPWQLTKHMTGTHRFLLFITFTDNTSVFMVTAVVGPQPIVATLCKLSFMADAVDIIQPYRPLARSKKGPL